MILAAFVTVALLVGLAPAQQPWPKATSADDGLRIWHFESAGERFRIVVLAGYGSRMDLEQESGAAHLLQHVLARGSAVNDADVLAGELERANGRITSALTKETLALGISVPAEHWELAVRQLGQRVAKPRFVTEEIDEQRDLLSRERVADHVFTDPLDAVLFPESSLGRSPLDHRGVASLSRERLAELHRLWFRPKNMIVAFAGSVETDKCVELIVESFAGLPRDAGGDVPEPATPLTGSHRLAALPERDAGATDYLVTGMHVRERGPYTLLALLALRIYFQRGLDQALEGASVDKRVEVRTYSDAWRIQCVFVSKRAGVVRACEHAFDRLASRVREGQLDEREVELAKSDVGRLLEVDTDDDLHRVVRWLDLVDEELGGVPDLKLASHQIPVIAMRACLEGDEFRLVHQAGARWPHVLLAFVVFVLVVGDGLTGFTRARGLYARVASFVRERRAAASRGKGKSDTLTLEIREYFAEEDRKKDDDDE